MRRFTTNPPFRFLAFTLLLISATMNAQGQSTSPSPTSDALSSTPWFDAAEGNLVPVIVSERIDDSVNRKSRWLPKPKKLSKPVASPAANPATGGTTTGGGAGIGTGLFGSGMSLGNLFGWMILALVILVAVGGIVYAFSKTDIDLGKPKDAKQISNAAPDKQTIERMKHLPIELLRTDINLRTEAERLMTEGRYDQAIILLFGHQLLMLDQAGALRLTRGKTNGRYLRESRSHDREMGDSLQKTITAFERSYFGRHLIHESEFRDLWDNNEALEKRVTMQKELAA